MSPEEFFVREKRVIKLVKEYREENHEEDYLGELFGEENGQK